MEKELLKLMAQLTLIGVVVWVIALALGKTKQRKANPAQSDPTQIIQKSNAWRYDPVTGGPGASPFSTQPGSSMVG